MNRMTMLLVALLVLSPSFTETARAQAGTPADRVVADTTAGLPPERVEEFAWKALDNVERLGIYLSVISDKESYPEEVDKALDLALKLFISDKAVVEVSSAHRTGPPRTFTIGYYLGRLRALPYYRVEISWAEVAYVSQLRRGDDGRFYGTASIQQRFVGYNEDDVPVYEDVTIKHIHIVLRQFFLDKPGEETPEWEVLLSDISVEQTSAM